MSTPRVRLPRSASPGEAIEVRTLIDHPMTTGIGSPNPRDMLARFEARANGEVVFAYDFDNGAAANPTFTFHVRLDETTDFVFVWIHEDGRVFETDGRVSVG